MRDHVLQEIWQIRLLRINNIALFRFVVVRRCSVCSFALSVGIQAQIHGCCCSFIVCLLRDNISYNESQFCSIYEYFIELNIAANIYEYPCGKPG